MATSVGSHLTRKKQHFPYEIAVLCYDSPSSVGKTTLALLHAYRIPPQRITLFVQSKSDEQHIVSNVSRHRYGHLIIGERGSQAMETFLHQHYAPGTLLVVLTDSCLGFLDKTASNGVLKSLLGVIRAGFEACKTSTSGFWGVYPVAEEAFLRPTISSKLAYTSPVFWGCITMPIQYTTHCYTHYERILQYYTTYSAIVRLNHIAVRCTRAIGSSQEEATAIQRQYPNWVTLNTESSGVHLRLHDITRHSKNSA
jgi:hypothetical protein